MHAVDTVLHEIEADRGSPAARVEQGGPRRPRRREEPPRCASRFGRDLRRDRRRDARAARRGRRPAARARARITEFVVPYERGDVLAALHRAGEVLVEVHGDHGDARAGPALRSGGRSLRRVRPRPRLVSVRMAATGGFVPPPYPYERLDALKRLADSLPGGVVDCSIGTPVRPRPRGREQARRRAALAASNGLSAVGGQRGAARRRRGVDRAAVRCRGGGRARRCVRGDQGARRVAAASLAARARRRATRCCTRRSRTRATRWARCSPGAAECPSRSTRSGTSTSTRSATTTPRAHSCCGSTSPATRRHRPPEPTTSRGLRRGGATTA